MTNQRQAALAEVRNANRKIARTTKFIVVENLAAFSGFAPDTYDCSVDCNGTVCVYDSVANAMTSNHAISDVDQARIRQGVADNKAMI